MLTDFSPRRLWARLPRRRSRVDVSPVLLDRKRIYILPTRDGLLFGLVLMTMLFGAINYNNSLAYALTFLLASLGVISILHAFRNLNGLRITAAPCPPVFAGSEGRLPLHLENTGPERNGLSVGFVGGESQRTVDIAAASAVEIDLTQIAHRRGRMGLAPVVLATRFPLGLFRAWTRLHFRAECLVYPRPESTNARPPPALLSGVGESTAGDEDFDSVRPYRPGDSFRHIDWKALAREQGLQTKRFVGQAGEPLWLSWELTRAAGSVEPRLSRLCRWVLEADCTGVPYGLALPGERIGPGQGEAHRRRCLEALALFQAG